jgi:hypothetical protein
MRKDGAANYIRIPNQYGIEELMKLHHYALTGIAALLRQQAIEYWQLATGEAAEHDGADHQPGEQFYLSGFARNGVAVKSRLQQRRTCALACA